MWVVVRSVAKHLLRRIIEDPGGNIGIKGEWTFLFSDGRKIEAENTLAQDGLNLMGDLILGAQPNSQIPIWLTLGTGTAAATINDHTLGAEGYRQQDSTAARDTGTSLLRIRTFLLPTQGIGNWTEGGIVFGGTSLANTGTLINHVVPAGGILKPSGNLSLTIECRLTLAGS